MVGFSKVLYCVLIFDKSRYLICNQNMATCRCTFIVDESRKSEFEHFWLICNNVYVAVSKINTLIHSTTIWKKTIVLEKVVKKRNAFLVGKLQILESNIKRETNKIQVELNNLKV